MKNKILLAIPIVFLTGGVIAYWRISVQRSELRSELKRTIENDEAGIEVRVEAAAKLWDLDEDAETVLTTLTEGLEAEYPVSERAAKVFVSMGGDAKAASQALMEAAKKPPAMSVLVEDQGRWRQFIGSASRALFQIGVDPTSRTEFLGALGDCLQDDDRLNDGQFLELLSIIDSDPQKSIPLHVRAIENEDPAGVRWAHEYLIRLDPTDTSATGLLVQGLKNESPAVRRWCLAGLIKIGAASSDAFPSVAGALRDEDEGVLRIGALWMGMIGRQGQSELQRLERGQWTPQAQFAIDWALRQDHREDALNFIGIPRLAPRTVRQANRNPTETVFTDEMYDSMRSGSVEKITNSLHKCIAAIADERLRPLIRTNTMLSLSTGWGPVMGAAMSRLESIRRHCPEDVRYLTLAGIACLSDGNPSVRLSACRFLEALGQDAELAVPALAVQSEYDHSSTTAAEAALHVIAPGL